jgi:hypothetical protein
MKNNINNENFIDISELEFEATIAPDLDAFRKSLIRKHLDSESQSDEYNYSFPVEFLRET